jgi:hypothetical protein
MEAHRVEVVRAAGWPEQLGDPRRRILHAHLGAVNLFSGASVEDTFGRPLGVLTAERGAVQL